MKSRVAYFGRWVLAVTLVLALLINVFGIRVVPAVLAGAAWFPCAGHGCGCTSAEICRTSCCCVKPIVEESCCDEEHGQVAPAADEGVTLAWRSAGCEGGSRDGKAAGAPVLFTCVWMLLSRDVAGEGDVVLNVDEWAQGMAIEPVVPPPRVGVQYVFCF